MAIVAVTPTEEIRPFYSPDGGRPGWKTIASLELMHEKDIIALEGGSPAAVIASASALRDALSRVIALAQADLAQGWTEAMVDGPVAAIPESELRLLAGDR
jgi:hypothetical protein